MALNEFLSQLATHSDTVEFADVMAVIDANYDFKPVAFKNGELLNAAGTNNGSCKIFAFGKLNGLDEATTLSCFGEYYRVDVLQNPLAEDHQNIRNFMKSGWAGIEFLEQALTPK
ncbi:MAG: HopJ type III effector protein [Pseudomonadales bacterium]|nr:HopJ type III effector protein [Pseudomonadales bacterium]